MKLMRAMTVIIPVRAMAPIVKSRVFFPEMAHREDHCPSARAMTESALATERVRLEVRISPDVLPSEALSPERV
jgi:hypothetical protein